MPTLGELSVLIGAEVNEAGFSRAVGAIAGIGTSSQAAAATSTAAMGQIGAAADKSAQRIADSGGRIRDGFGRYVNSAQLAAEAAGNVGGKLGTLGDIAGRTSTTINGGLVSSFARLDASIKPLNEGIGRLGEGLQSAGAGLTASITAPLALLGGASLKAAGDIQALEKGFAATYTGTEELSVALAKVQELAKLPGLGLKEAEQGATNLQAAGFSAELARRALGAFGNALATVGKGKADLDGVGLALGQIASKGKISAEEIGQLAERVPQIRKAIQAAFGTSDSDALQKLGIGATEFVDKVTTELEKLPKVSGGINNAFENLSDAGTISLAKLGTALNKAFDVEGIIGKLSDALTGAAAAFERLDPGTQKLIFGLAAGAAAIGPLLLGIGAIVAAIPSVIAGFAALSITSAAALGPIALAATAAAAGALLIYQNWDRVAPLFAGIGDTLGQVADILSASFTTIGQLLNSLGITSGTAKGVLSSLGAALTDLLVFPLRVVGGVLDIVVGSLRGVINLLTGDFKGALAGGSQALDGFKQALFGIQKERIVSFDEFFGIAASAKKATEQVDYFADSVATATRQAGLLAELQKQLKAAQDAKPNLTTEPAIAANNRLVASLEAEIKRLSELGIGSKQAQDALSKLRAELAALSALDDVLARPAEGIDTVNRRIKALESGLKNLLTSGVSVNSAPFKAYAKELLTLQQGLAKLQATSQLDFSIVAQVKLGLTNGEKYGAETAAILGAEFASHPVGIPYRLEPIKADFTGDITDTLRDLDSAFAKAGVSSATFGSSFDFLGARAEALKAALQDLIDKGVSPTSPAFQKLKQDYIEAKSASENLKEITSAVSDGFVALGTALGSSLVNGGNILGAVLASLIDALADYAEKKGKLLIADGIGSIAMGNVGQGALLIAAGTGLLVAAGAAHAGASALRSSGGGGTGGSPSLANQPGTPNSNTATQKQQPIEVIARFELRGQDLVAIGRLNDYREKRTR